DQRPRDQAPREETRGIGSQHQLDDACLDAGLAETKRYGGGEHGAADAGEEHAGHDRQGGGRAPCGSPEPLRGVRGPPHARPWLRPFALTRAPTIGAREDGCSFPIRSYTGSVALQTKIDTAMALSFLAIAAGESGVSPAASLYSRSARFLR